MSVFIVSHLFLFPSFCFSLSVSIAELNVELSRPLKINPTLAKLEQAKAYLNKILPNHTWDTSSKPPSASSTPHSSPAKTLPRAFPSRSDPHHQALGKVSGAKALWAPGTPGARALSFHKVSLHTAQIVVVMETEAHPMRPSVTVTVSAMTGSLNRKSGPRIEGEWKTNILNFLQKMKNLCSLFETHEKYKGHRCTASQVQKHKTILCNLLN